MIALEVDVKGCDPAFLKAFPCWVSLYSTPTSGVVLGGACLGRDRLRNLRSG